MIPCHMCTYILQHSQQPTWHIITRMLQLKNTEDGGVYRMHHPHWMKMEPRLTFRSLWFKMILFSHYVIACINSSFTYQDTLHLNYIFIKSFLEHRNSTREWTRPNNYQVTKTPYKRRILWWEDLTAAKHFQDLTPLLHSVLPPKQHPTPLSSQLLFFFK